MIYAFDLILGYTILSNLSSFLEFFKKTPCSKKIKRDIFKNALN